MPKRVYINPTDPNASSYRAALITHPAKFEIVSSPALADIEAGAMMPEGDQATWATSYFVADAEIESEDLIGKTIEISIEVSRLISADARLDEAMSVLVALGIAKLDDLAITRAAKSVGVAGFHRQSRVAVVHRTVPSDKAKLYISITDPKMRVTLNAPLGATAMAAEVSGHSVDGTTTLRPLYRSTISRWLANY